MNGGVAQGPSSRWRAPSSLLHLLFPSGSSQLPSSSSSPHTSSLQEFSVVFQFILCLFRPPAVSTATVTLIRALPFLYSPYMRVVSESRADPLFLRAVVLFLVPLVHEWRELLLPLHSGSDLLWNGWIGSAQLTKYLPVWKKMRTEKNALE